MKAAVLLGASLLCSCSGTSPASETDIRANRIAQLAEITSKCHLPASTLKLVGIDKLQFQPEPSAKFEDVDCALRGVKALPFHLNMGFVGNEVSEPEKK